MSTGRSGDESSWGEPSPYAGGDLLVREARGALEVSFNRPDKHNAFTDAMYAALVTLCARLREDEQVRAVVFTGEGGRAFAAGNDITSFLAFRDGDDGVTYEAKVREVLDAVASLPQVSVAAVDGICVGGGLAVANACDLRVAAASARFGFPIAHTLGNALSAGIVLRCVQVWGDPATREMLLTAGLLTAERGYGVGALAAVVPADELEAHVWALVERVVRAAPLTLRTTKEQLRDGAAGYSAEVDDARLAAAYGSRDFREGVRAFVAKETPRFTG